MNPSLAICYVFALLLTLWALHDFGMYQHRCMRCGQRGKHADDCDRKK